MDNLFFFFWFKKCGEHTFSNWSSFNQSQLFESLSVGPLLSIRLRNNLHDIKRLAYMLTTWKCRGKFPIFALTSEKKITFYTSANFILILLTDYEQNITLFVSQGKPVEGKKKNQQHKNNQRYTNIYYNDIRVCVLSNFVFESKFKFA